MSHFTPNITFSNILFEQIGGVNWQLRPDSVLHIGLESDENLTSLLSRPMQNSQSNSSASLQTLDSTSDVITIVVLGQGLNDIWQNDAQQAWLLWQNIMQVFNWDEANMVFFDTSHIVSEEMLFTTMEEIVELGVDWVLSMDEEHALADILQEGMHVIQVPDIETMLMDSYAKQTFYNTVISIAECS
ncbi:hypothetical protein MNBD_GAMMA03-772 [hydrothermal vent metagenome]|uniref:Uncharacterized protein n=1 Tax=hydrothermal vent metagenome TaxID=652676 RepID=A0A3B0W5X4_9ZZZZ